MDFKSLVKHYQSIEENSSIGAESKEMLLAYYKNTFPKQTKISFNIYHSLVPVGISLLVLLFIFVSVLGLMLGAKNTLPGNFLYPVKLGYEEARIITIFDISKKAVLRAEILTNRLSEAKVLARRKEKGEKGLEQDMQYLAESFTHDLQTLKKQIAAQVPVQEGTVPEGGLSPTSPVPFPEEELLATPLSLRGASETSDEAISTPTSPDLPISDKRQIFTVIQSDKLEALLSETKELLARKDLVTALLRIKEAQKLTEDSSLTKTPDVKEERSDTLPPTPDVKEERSDTLPPTPDVKEERSDGKTSGVKDSQTIESEPINDQPGSVGQILPYIEQESDFSIDTEREEPISTGMIRE